MRSSVTGEAQVAGNADFGLGDAVVSAQVGLLVFDCPLEPLDEHIVAPASLAIHADLNSAALKHADEGRTGELAALIRIHDLGRPDLVLFCKTSSLQ